MATQAPTFVSAASANALISDLRPTTLSTPALNHLNLLLDELLTSLLTSSQSLNPTDLRLRGIPGSFSGEEGRGGNTGLRALGRSAVGEAELELRSWYDSHPSASRGERGKGFPPGGRGNGTVRDVRFPLQEAVEVMRIKIMTFSTLAPQTPPSQLVEERVMSKWISEGGDGSDETLSPAGLWITAILEHVCEHILAQLSRVVARDSSIATAGVQDLYVALCEDETVYGFFKRMQVKDLLEQAIRSGTRTKRVAPPRHDEGRSSPASTSPHGSNRSVASAAPPVRQTSFDLPPTAGKKSSSIHERASMEQGAKMRKSASINRKGFMGSSSSSHSLHERSPSVLSANTRSMLGAFNDELDSTQDEEEFDALVRSNETMKVSLTPSRLKSFEPSGGRKMPNTPPRQSPARIPRATTVQPSLPLPTPPRDAEEEKLSPLLPHTVLPGSTDLLNRGAMGGKVRSTSSQKLVPRGATIEENDEDDDPTKSFGGARKRRQESLVDILNLAPPMDPSSRFNGSTKRTVPAVVVGTPPPPAPVETVSQPRRAADSSGPLRTSPSVNRPNREIFDDLDEKPLKPKTPAQELADFLANTAPPASPPSSYPDDSSATTKKGGFRSFMSKVTGSRKNSDPSLSGLSTSASMTKLNQPRVENGNGPKRQQSLVNVSGVPPKPTSTRQPDAPAVPNDTEKPLPVGMFTGVSPKHSSPAQKPDAPAVRRGSSPYKSDRKPVPAVDVGVGAAAVASALLSSDRPTQAPTIISAAQSNPRTSPRQPVPLPTQINSVNLAGGQVIEDEYIRVEKPNVPLATESQNEPLMAPTVPVAAVAPVPGQHDKSVSEVSSFQTAKEDDESAPIPPAKEESVEGIPDHKSEVAIGSDDPEPVLPTTVVSKSPEMPAVPSIPLTELAPLRHLLDHATSARECRLLLNAILSQYGVPLTSGPTSIQTPDSRVAAWLLAGRDGPVFPAGLEAAEDTPSSSTFSKHGQEEEVVTPTQVQGEMGNGHTLPVDGMIKKINGHSRAFGSGETEELVSP